MPTYREEVLRLGGRKPYEDAEGKQIYLNQKTAFSWQDIKIDSDGNRLESPLLERKPCFGRPERFFRGDLEQGKEAINEYGNRVRTLTRCERCLVSDACAYTCDVRINSDPNVISKFTDWSDATNQQIGNAKFQGSANYRLWHNFLLAIIAHGGWSNLNDARVSANQILKKEKRDEARRANAKATRKARTLKPHVKHSITSAQRSALQNEHDRRLEVLLDLRKQRLVPRWIGNLSIESCERTATVWMARMILERLGAKATGKAIASWLVSNGLAQDGKLTSLCTSTCRTLNRVKKLEDGRAGTPIWLEFRWAA